MEFKAYFILDCLELARVVESRGSKEERKRK